RGAQRSLLLLPPAHVLERVGKPPRLDAQPFEDFERALLGPLRLKAVKIGRVEQVFARRQFLVEGGVDAHAPDLPAHGALFLREPVPHQTYFAMIGNEQRRKDPNQRRFARTVRPQQPVSLAMRDLERHVFHGPLFVDRVFEDALTLALAKYLLQLTNFYCLMMIV